MSDFVVTNCTPVADSFGGGDPVDIEIRDGRIDRVVPAGEGDPASFDPDRRHDAEGRLVSPPLVEPHTHLFTALTAGVPRWNASATLEEGWRLWVETEAEMDPADYRRRARRVLSWFAANGITRVRTHIDTSTAAALEGVEAMIEVREELAGTVDLQIVAFPMGGLVSGDDVHLENLHEALDMGLDVVGGIPHREHTAEDGAEHVRTVVDVADARGLPLDLHIDESDDPQTRTTGVLASEVLKRGIGDRTTASHVTALHSYPNAYADKLIRLLAESGMRVVTNPMSNAVLQGRYDDYPRRRGHTRVEQLREAGVTVGLGQDNVVDHFHSYGDGDPLKAAFVLAHLAHMNGPDDVPALWEMLTRANAEVFGLDDYGLAAGNEGSLVVYDARDQFDALRTHPVRPLVLRDGERIARSDRSSVVVRDGEERPVDFGR